MVRYEASLSADPLCKCPYFAVFQISVKNISSIPLSITESCFTNVMSSFVTLYFPNKFRPGWCFWSIPPGKDARIAAGTSTLRTIGDFMLATQEDGRRIRSERTRQRILNSLLALIGEGQLRPRPEEIADRAETTSRTVFRHFTDLETLYEEARQAIDRQLETAPELQTDVSGDFSTRAAALARLQGQHFEQMRPFLLFSISHANTVDEATRPRTIQVQGQRLRLWSTLPECAAACPSARRSVEQLFSFQCWDQLRREQKLSVDETIETITRGAQLFIEAGSPRAGPDNS